MPYTVSSGTTINANDINQLVNILEAPSGAQEIGKYHVLFSGFQTGAQGGIWVQTQSRTSTPVSVTIDSADQAPTNCTALATATLKSSGFQIFATSTGAWTACNVGGNYTLQFAFLITLMSATLLSMLLGFAPHFV